MGFEILIETYSAEDRITKMLNTLQVVPVPAELTEWQIKDMKRKRPDTEAINPTTGLTHIYPRGRPALMKRKSVLRSPIKKAVLRGMGIRRTQQPSSNKPILRPALFMKLRERMNEMMQREIKW
jgi:hypothetical protein